jgi:ATP dependent DNA ligase C terminal region
MPLRRSVKTMQTTNDDSFSDFEDQHSGATATLDIRDVPESAEDSEWSGPQCQQCEAPLKSDVVTVCRHCGWYASLGTYVEIDKDWEFHGEGEDETAASQPQASHLEVWLHLLPRWAWIMIGTAVFVVVESAAVRLFAPCAGSLRGTWALAQMAGGYLTFFVCHLINLLIVAGDDADVGVVDLLLKPVKLWMRACRDLPKRLWVANGAANGLLAAELALWVIGGINYDQMWDWGFKQPPKESLMAAVMSQAAKAKGDGAKDLEEAIGNFASQAGLDHDSKKTESTPKPAEKPRRQTDCVILGYHADKDGNVLSLVLGTALEGRLVYAGSLTPKLEGDDLAAFTKALVAARADQPFLDVQSDATWVRPKFSCRVSYIEQDEAGRLSDAVWVKVLGTTGL